MRLFHALHANSQRNISIIYYVGLQNTVYLAEYKMHVRYAAAHISIYHLELGHEAARSCPGECLHHCDLRRAGVDLGMGKGIGLSRCFFQNAVLMPMRRP